MEWLVLRSRTTKHRILTASIWSQTPGLHYGTSPSLGDFLKQLVSVWAMVGQGIHGHGKFLVSPFLYLYVLKNYLPKNLIVELPHEPAIPLKGM